MIVDSGPLVAASNTDETNHELALQVLAAAGSSAHTALPVLVEVDHLTRWQRPHDPPVLRLLEAISAGELKLQPVTTETLDDASELDRRYLDLQLGLTDSVVMILAQQTGMPVFMFDFRDFRAVTVGGRALELVVAERDVES